MHRPVGDDLRLALLGDHQPWDQIRVVFSLADQDPITGAQARSQVALGDQVDRFGRAFAPDNFMLIGPDQRRRLTPGAFEAFGEVSGSHVLAAVYRGTVVGVIGLNGLQHRPWFQCGGGAVQVNAVRSQRREVAAQRHKVKRHGWDLSNMARKRDMNRIQD